MLDLPHRLGEYGAGMEGLDISCSALGRQMTLPLRLGGLGKHLQSDEVLDAAFVAGAGKAERNLKGRPAALCPLQGACGASVRERWCSLHAQPPHTTFTHSMRSSATGTQQRRPC